MKPFFINLVVGLSLFNLSAAQIEVGLMEEPVKSESYYAGVGASFVLIYPVLHAHFGFSDLIAEQVDLRFSVELFPYVYNLSADAIFQRAGTASPFSSYTGAGVRLVYLNDVYNREFLPGVGGLLGVNYDFGSAKVFGEFEFDVVLAPSDLRGYLGIPVVPIPLLRLGVEFPF